MLPESVQRAKDCWPNAMLYLSPCLGACQREKQAERFICSFDPGAVPGRRAMAIVMKHKDRNQDHTFLSYKSNPQTAGFYVRSPKKHVQRSHKCL